LGSRARAGLLAVLCLLASGTASAQAIDDASRTAARALGTSGVEEYQAGHHQAASDRLEKAYAIARVPSLGLWSARSLRELGKLVEAADRYLETVSLQVPEGDYVIQKQAQTDATRELNELKLRIPVLRIEVKGANAGEVSVSVDGTPLAASLVSEPRLVNPGEHRVEGAHGADRATAKVTVAEASRATAVLDFSTPKAAAPASGEGGGGSFQAKRRVAANPPEAAAPSSSSAMRLAGLVTAGAGVIVVGIGTYLALDAKSAYSEARKRCVGLDCAPGPYDDIQAARRQGDIASVVLGLGGTTLATGAALWLLAPNESRLPPQTASVRLERVGASPSGLLLRGSF
jgi:hypothetical protein